MSTTVPAFRVAINGFGRIGRYTAKLLLKNPEFNLVAINDLADPAAIAHLLKYDSVHGKFDANISQSPGVLRVDDQQIELFSESNPENLPWKGLNIDLVFECTGRFTLKKDAEMHLVAGAKKVIISAPSQEASIPMVVLGVNEHVLLGGETIVSNASCTTNCLAPLVKVLDENFGILNGFASTVHSYTNDQNLHDAPHKDLRRARAAAYSIIPTSTNAGKALDRVLPALASKIEASAMRVPVQEVTAQQVNEAFKMAAVNELKGYLQVESDPIVSMDILGNTHSAILDEALTATKGNLIKVVAWYDNESGYANRLVDLAKKISNR
jgi:glyceraldehyde 3-phosphate dehydrogenase